MAVSPVSREFGPSASWRSVRILGYVFGHYFNAIPETVGFESAILERRRIHRWRPTGYRVGERSGDRCLAEGYRRARRTLRLREAWVSGYVR